MAQPIHQPEDDEFGGQIEPKYSDLPRRLTEQVPAEASGIFQGLGIKGGGTVRGSAAVTLHLVAIAGHSPHDLVRRPVQTVLRFEYFHLLLKWKK